jgi:hypothetical protein
MPPKSAEVLDAVDDVVESLEEACTEGELAAEQARDIRRRAEVGLPMTSVLTGTDSAPLVRQVAKVLHDLGQASSRLRRAEARALHGEGVTTERIAELFGVTRQRISALLRPTGAKTPETVVGLPPRGAPGK